MSKERTCIKCSGSMVPKLVEEVEVDYCPGCGGLWLDESEIRQLAKKSEEALVDLRELVAGTSFDVPADSTVDAPCPACDGKLMLAALGSLQIEHCAGCEGIYLDRGELDKVMTLANARGKEGATIVALAKSVVTSGAIGGDA